MNPIKGLWGSLDHPFRFGNIHVKIPNDPGSNSVMFAHAGESPGSPIHFKEIYIMAKKTLGSAKRFGPRYGKTVKGKVAKIEAEQRKLHKCPYCAYVKVKRVAAGIWQCRKCGAKFTGKAYSPQKRKLAIKTGEKDLLVDKNILLSEEELEPKVEEPVENGEI